MLWIVLILLGLSIAAILYEASLPPEERASIRKARERRRRERERRRAQAGPPPRNTVQEEIERDPVHALARYGTPEVAERLMAQGIDLEALGYQPPDKG
jgi:hypothetical protein